MRSRLSKRALPNRSNLFQAEFEPRFIRRGPARPSIAFTHNQLIKREIFATLARPAALTLCGARELLFDFAKETRRDEPFREAAVTADLNFELRRGPPLRHSHLAFSYDAPRDKVVGLGFA
jgi:hypothetical protein